MNAGESGGVRTDGVTVSRQWAAGGGSRPMGGVPLRQQAKRRVL